MSQTNKDKQNNNWNLDTFDEDDDLWALQSDKSDTPEIDIDGFTEDEAKPLDLSPPAKSNIAPTENNQPLETIIDNSTTDSEEIKKEKEISPVVEEEEEISNLENDIINSINNIDNPPEVVKPVEIIEPVEEQSPELIVHQEESLANKTSINPVTTEISENINLLVKNSLQELEQKKENLENSIAQLERRQRKIQQEMKTTFAGASQDLAIRVQGFKDYLVGSLQDLAAAAEQLELTSGNEEVWKDDTPTTNPTTSEDNPTTPQFAEENFTQERQEIRRLLDQYRLRPDYYGPAWQLRRTFEPIHAQQVRDWFFTQGGRGALTSMGSRLQNILIGSAIISILSHLYGDRSRILILADTPEKLGEWRRGLQDCLGISRSDFGPNRGVILFETATALVKKGDRIVEQDDLPLVIMDLDDDRVSLSLLKFPLWLAFAPKSPVQNDEYYY